MKLQLIPAVTHQKRTNNHFSLLSSNYTLKKKAIPATLTRQEKTVKEVMLKQAQPHSLTVQANCSGDLG